MRRRQRAPRWARELAAVYSPWTQPAQHPIRWLFVFDREEPEEDDVIRRAFGRLRDQLSRADRNRIARALVTYGAVHVYSSNLGVGLAVSRALDAAIARGADGNAALRVMNEAGGGARAARGRPGPPPQHEGAAMKVIKSRSGEPAFTVASYSSTITITRAELEAEPLDLVAELERRQRARIEQLNASVLAAAFAYQPPERPPPAPPRPPASWWLELLGSSSAPHPATWTLDGWRCPFRRWLRDRLAAYYLAFTDRVRAEWLAAWDLSDDRDRAELLAQAERHVRSHGFRWRP